MVIRFCQGQILIVHGILCVPFIQTAYCKCGRANESHFHSFISIVVGPTRLSAKCMNVKAKVSMSLCVCPCAMGARVCVL